MGEHSYMAEGGVLPAAGLGWDKEAEAVTAKYADRRGAETLTLLLYPTPNIAAGHICGAWRAAAGAGAELCACEDAARGLAGGRGER